MGGSNDNRNQYVCLLKVNKRCKYNVKEKRRTEITVCISYLKSQFSLSVCITQPVLQALQL